MSRIILFSSIVLWFISTNTFSQNVYTTTNNTAKVGIGYSIGSSLPDVFNIRRVGTVGDLMYDINGNILGNTGNNPAAIRFDYQLPVSGNQWRSYELRSTSDFEIRNVTNNITPFTITPTENIFRNNVVRLNDNNPNTKVTMYSNTSLGHGILINNHSTQSTLGFAVRIQSGNGNGTELFKVNSDGRVIIPQKLVVGSNVHTGAHNDFALSVNGKIVGKSLVATIQSWADYVFEDDYQLLEFDELRDFIAKNKHLPGLPSSNQIIGLEKDVIEINTLLLLKIEELYLYILKLDKMINDENIK